MKRRILSILCIIALWTNGMTLHAEENNTLTDAIIAADTVAATDGIGTSDTAPDGEITDSTAADRAVSDDAIAGNTVQDETVNNAMSGSAIADGAAPGAAAPDSAIADDTVSDGVVADNAVSDNVIADNTVSDSAAADGIVSDGVIADDTISDDIIADNTVSDGAAADDIVSDGVIADDTVSNSIITDVVLPCNYTELYSKLNITEPVWYDTLTCEIDGVETVVSGITWKSDDYVADKPGIYTFSAVAPLGYQFAENGIPTITVRVRESEEDTANAGTPNRTGHFYSRDTVASDTITGFYGTVTPGLSDSSKTRVCDFTGRNAINKADTSNNIRLAGGVDYATAGTLAGTVVGDTYAANPTELTAKIGLKGATIHSMYGGSYGNIFKGTTDIYVENGKLNAKGGIYAGSVNGDFEGTTNIYLSGNTTVPLIYLGSTYSTEAKVSGSGAVVGKKDVSYQGTVNVYIADDFTGIIEKIESATGAQDAVTANIYLPSTAREKISEINVGGGTTFYVDNVPVPKTVTAIYYEGETQKLAPMGTAKEDLGLEKTLRIVCGDVEYRETGFEWDDGGYSSETEGDYIFTPILPADYDLSGGVAIPTVGVRVKDGTDVMENVTLPCSYTELYSKLNITEPVLYDILTCEIGGVETVVSGITWKSDDYVANKPGIYTFSAVAPLGYQFAENGIPTITVRVRESEEDTANAGTPNRTGHFYSRDTAASGTITGFYGTVTPGLNDSSKTRVCDFTGWNAINKADTSNNIRLAGGVDYATAGTLAGTVVGDTYAANPTELTAKIGLKGATMHSIYGGSYGNIFKGTTDIYVENGKLTKGIYAGSVNGDFEGITNIYLSGDSTIPLLYLGSTYSKEAKVSGSGAIVGKEDVSYKGIVNVYIANDFKGSIGKITVPDGTGDEIEANIYISSACKFDIFSVAHKGANLYVDGKDGSKYMSSVIYEGESFIVVPEGTAKEDITFDGALKIVYGGEEYTETEAAWDCGGYQADVPGVYSFTPILPSKYEPVNTPVLPEVKVCVAAADGIEITGIDVGVPLETRIPERVVSLNTPEKALITYTYAGEKHTAEIAVSYTQENYVPEKGEYILSIESVQEPYRLSEKIADTADIRVQVVDVSSNKAGDVYSFDNAFIAISAKDRGDYRITDVARLYTYYDNVSVIYAINISGENPRLEIESTLVYIESDIAFRDIEGNAEAEVAKSLVTKIRTECPDNVTVNGISLGSFGGKTVTEKTGSREDGRNVFYFNGIPGILARGEDGGTYAYRSYDRKKLSETNLAGWIVSGGAQGAGSVVETTNVRFESGTVYQLFAGGEGTTLDAAMILDGGAVAYSSFGGAMSGGTVGKTTIVYEFGDSKRRAYAGGDGAVLGDPDRSYADDEYSVEVWLFDCAIQYVNLGGRNEDRIYGNIKFEQYGGSLLNLYTGGTKEGHHYGDVDITVYGGIWEKAFEQQALQEGNARLKLYEGIHREEFIEYPLFEKKNDSKYTLEVEYFSRADEFQFIEYTDKREEVVDTSQDTGSLVVRFLETKVADGFDKGSVKIRDGTGDSIFITFPNGQNMLIDTGTSKGGEFIVQDLKDLGVTKLDYVMITHEHTDHMGALGAICGAFEVETFLYQKYVKTAKTLLDAVTSEGAQVIYLGFGDSFNVGEVRFDVIGPEEELLATATDVNIGSIAAVMTYGESKVLFTGDSLSENEESWLAKEETKALISNCQLLKLCHHGIFNANSPEFLAAVNADKYIITQMREYGTQLGQAVAQLQGGFGVTWDDIYVTGRHGMIKAVIGADGKVDMSCQYVKTTPYYADYSKLDTLLDSVDTAKLSPEKLGIWTGALERVKRDYAYEEQGIVDGLCTYISTVIKEIAEVETEPTPTPSATPEPTPTPSTTSEPTPTPGTTPEPTPTPGSTPQPTPAPTLNPGSTSDGESDTGSEGSGMSNSTESTKAPATPKPTADANASATSKPAESTKSPEDTKAPESTKSPEDTKAPESTKSPEDSKEPENSEGAENSNAADASNASEDAEPTEEPETITETTVQAAENEPDHESNGKFKILMVVCGGLLGMCGVGAGIYYLVTKKRRERK